MPRRYPGTKHETDPHPVAGYLAGGPSSPRSPVMLSNLIESFTVCARKRFAKSLFLLALSVLTVLTAALPRLSSAQSAEPAAAPAAAPATPAAAPTLDAKAIEERLGDLEAY